MSGCALPGVQMTTLISLLLEIQTAAYIISGKSETFDPKPYVDIPLRHPPDLTKHAWDGVPRKPDGSIAKQEFDNFLKQYTLDAGSDIEVVKLQDYEPDPPGFLDSVQNPKVRNWALQVHSKWLELTRRTSKSVETETEQHTLLYLPYPSVVPGSRFREVYYWDSYWVIRGLLVSKMVGTAQGIVRNLLSMASTYGFVPNGARSYYSNRSQPPLLSEMVRIVFNITGDLSLLEEALPLLIKEADLWSSAPHVVKINNPNTGGTYQLSRYYAAWDSPRPESYTIDAALGEKVVESRRQQLFLDVASAAESGWDFSSRWFHDHSNIETIQTTRIVPVDLNTFLYQLENNIANFARILGRHDIAVVYFAKSLLRFTAIEAILWDEDQGQWRDYVLEEDYACADKVWSFNPDQRNPGAFASNFVPIWIGFAPAANDGGARLIKVVDALYHSGLLHPAGISTTDVKTPQQWDFPNGWAPLQHMIIEGLAYSGTTEGFQTAWDLAQRWLKTNWQAYQTTGAMHEKYDVQKCGSVGGGGEYEPQTGFGWSNGVVLSLLELFGWAADTDIKCD